MTKKIVFHIGFHKTGTSWLQEVFFLKHPDINILNDFKQPWNDEFLKYLILSPDSKFDKDKLINFIVDKIDENKINIVTAERLSGHPISGGFDSTKIAQRIKICFPNSKIIIVKRNKVAFIKSIYKQIVKQGYCGTYNEFLSRNSWIYPGNSDDYFNHEYLIDYYASLFTSQNLLTLSFELFQGNKEEFIHELCDFLNFQNNIDNNDYNIIIGETFNNRKIRIQRFLNRFRVSEYNTHPLIKVNIKYLNLFNRLLEKIVSNRELE